MTLHPPHLQTMRERHTRRSVPKLRDLYPPNSEPQRLFLEAGLPDPKRPGQARARIAIIGGSAGGGKSYAEFLDVADPVGDPEYGAIIFRRTLKQHKDEGGMWDKAMGLFPRVNGRPNVGGMFWTFPSGASIQFAGIETEADKLTYQGSEFAKIVFDEVTHFLESQFFYLLSRNRSHCSVPATIRGSCNPEPGWVKRLLAPWVDRTFPNPASSGEIRWFIREHGQIVWINGEPPDRGVCSDGENGDNCFKEGCLKCFPPEISITFIRATVYDNRDLLKANPDYITGLKNLPDLDRKRLLDGDWDARPANLVLDAFSESRNVVSWRDTTGWRKYVGADFGLNNSAQVVLAEDPSNRNLYVIGEHWPGHDLPYETVAAEIRRMAGGTPTDGAGGNRTLEQGWRQAMRKEGIPMAEPDIKHKDPGLQYKCVNDLFRETPEQPSRLFVFEECTVLIKMMLEFQRKIDPKDGLPTDEFDDGRFHLCAALRYICVKLRPPRGEGAAPTTIMTSKPEDQVAQHALVGVRQGQIRSVPGGGFIPG